MVSIVLLTGAAWAAPYSGGSGTQANPYRIKTVLDWQALTFAAGDWGKYFVLMSDLDLAGVADLKPVGGPGTRFTGVFDGQGHTIRNAVINRPDTDYMGLFGRLGEGGWIWNLGVVDVNVVGRDYVGGLLGENYGGTITSCYATGIVTGQQYVGGLVGLDMLARTVDSCHAAAAVRGTRYVGGLVGFGGGTIALSYALGTVEGQEYVGGLAGRSNSTVCYSYAKGDVTGQRYVGGLVGQNSGSTITSCCAAGAVSGQDYVGGLVGYESAGVLARDLCYLCYATGAISGGRYVGGLVGFSDGHLTASYATGAISGDEYVGGLLGCNSKGKVAHCYSTGRPTGAASVGGLCGGVVTGAGYENTGNFWDTQTSEMLISAMGTGRTTSQMQRASTFAGVGWDLLDVWEIIDGIDYPRLRWRLSPGTYSGGSGTQADPYRIGAAEDWVELMVTPVDWSRHFVLVSDIDLTDEHVRPVGDSLAGFDGGFDGQGYAVSNVTIVRPGDGFLGLFGIAGSRAWIRNLDVVNVDVQGTGTVGGLAGRLDGKASFCSVTGWVDATRGYVGGLTGYNVGTVTSCHAAARVSGMDNNVGGLVGYNPGTITSSHATGVVSGSSDVGGLVGYNPGTILSSYATGTVGGTGYKVGGLIGRNKYGTVMDCYARGSAYTSGEQVGGLLGYNDSGKVIHCYSTGRLTGMGAGGLCPSVTRGTGFEDTGNFWDTKTSQKDFSAMGTGKTTSQMRMLSTFTDAEWDFEQIWAMSEGIGYPWLRERPLAARYSGGSGTWADPYRIGTPSDWKDLMATTDDWDKHLVLTSDIDLQYETLTPVGDSVSPFTGLFDGVGHTIHNAAIRLPDRDDVGLFGYVASGGGIENLGMVGTDMLGRDHVGGLVGVNADFGAIQLCYVDGTVSGRSSVGGLVGYDSMGMIHASYARADVNATGDYVGGLIGRSMAGRVTHCYSTGRPTGAALVGGLCGGVAGSGQDTGNFWDTETSEIGESAIGAGKTTEQMRTLSTFAAAEWDFADTWAICEGTGYPRLRWSIAAADFECPDGVAYEDLGYLAQRWLLDDCASVEECGAADLDGDGRVDLMDLAILADHWAVAGR